MQYGNAQSTYRRYYFLIAMVVLMFDQATKSLVARNLALHDTITVIPGFFSISHVLNPGAAFSLFADGASRYTTAGLIFFSLVVLSVGAAPAAGTTWMYVTGQVTILRGDITTSGLVMGQNVIAPNIGAYNNEFDVFAERGYAALGECVKAAVLVSVDCEVAA